MSERKVIVERPNKTIYLEDGKVYKVMGKEYPVSDVFNEALNLAAAGETGLKVPKIVEVRQIEGKWAIVWEYIEGTTLLDKMRDEPDRFEEFLERFVDIQLEMHGYNAPRLPALIEKLHRKIRASGLDATNRYELHTRLDSMPRHTKLCHGDFNPSNIVITGDDEAYIIDWSHATQGNASADAAQTWLIFSLCRDLFPENPDLPDRYLELFCIKSDTAVQYVKKWISLAAASQLVKRREEERDFLLRQVNVVEYD
ncbi:MAG: aminoglycoside phosphotransferase family protein [Treponema sp.]|jgi:aminoglycoside phosphotransferase (APT) family kinase protein|nr:aminoglycoside phosphotransferase family protein [Treponema sp.]